MESFWQTQPPPSGLSQPEIQMSYMGHKSQGQPIFYGLFHIRSDSQIPIAVIISHRRGRGDLIPSYSSYRVRIPGTVSKSCWWYWWYPEATSIPAAGYHWLCWSCFHGRMDQSMVKNMSFNITKASYFCMTETSIHYLRISTYILVPVQNINWKETWKI